MEEKAHLDKLPSRVKYYLLEWKDKNMNEFLTKYGERRLRDLTKDELSALFFYATEKDYKFITAKK